TYNGNNQIAYLNYYYNNAATAPASLNWWNGNPTNLRVKFIKTTGDDLNAGTNIFSAYAQIETPSNAATQYIFGYTATTAYTINKANAQAGFGGTTYGAIAPTLNPNWSKSGYYNISHYISYPSYTDKNVILLRYPVKYDSEGNFVADSEMAKLTDKDFVLGVWNGAGLSVDSFVELVKNGAGTNSFTVNYNQNLPTISDMASSINGGYGVYEGMYVEFTGQNINTFRVYFTLIMTDYDKFDSQTAASAAGFTGTFDKDAPWGSATNPYVISSWVHIARLMEIVNGTSGPINSVANMGICQGASITQPASSQISYLDGYFFVTADNTMVINGTTYHGLYLAGYSDAVDWQPIGSSDAYKFAGSFDGNGKALYVDIDVETASTRVGLFGYVRPTNSSSSIHDITSLGSIDAENSISVGGLIGEVTGNVRIYNVKNYANVFGASNVGGIVGVVNAGVNLGVEDDFSTLENYGVVAGMSTAGNVGGIAGVVYSGAGIKESENTYVLGANTGFVNWTESGVSSSGSNVGGIFDAMLLSGTANEFTRFQPAYARNICMVRGDEYVGGLFGIVKYSDTKGHIVYLINKENELSGDYYNEWSFCGLPDAIGNMRAGAILIDGAIVEGIHGNSY
ncbi:MAG: hypothetical protein MJ193_02950, partial [Clostridia bacterium]|nr:hypothetical protein [Clostridia bacterium]